MPSHPAKPVLILVMAMVGGAISGPFFSAGPFLQAQSTSPLTIQPDTGRVGIGTMTPAAKLQVAGDALFLAQKKVNSSASTYYVNTRRYHVEATKATVLTTVPLDMAIVNDLCKDEDGCAVTLGMRDWSSATRPGLTASQGPYRFFISQTSNWSRLSNTHAEAADGNGTVNHILQAWDCYFTDGEYVSGASSD